MRKMLIASLIVASLLLLASGAMADRGDDRARWDDGYGEDEKCEPVCPPVEPEEPACPPCPPIVIDIPKITYPDIDIDVDEAPCFPAICVGDFPEISCPDITFDFPEICCPAPCPTPAPAPCPEEDDKSPCPDDDDCHQMDRSNNFIH